MKILNLYAGIGGNRQLWEGDITAVEFDPEIAAVYKKRFPDDTIVIGDALEYLEEHYNNFDFIWSSPPCQSHGQYRHNVGVLAKGYRPLIPDMSLYAQIIFLKTYYKGIWVVENTKPYYSPLIPPSFVLQRHYFWSNGFVPDEKFSAGKIRSRNKISDFEGFKDVAESKIKNKRQALRNCVNPELGKYIFDWLIQEV